MIMYFFRLLHDLECNLRKGGYIKVYIGEHDRDLPRRILGVQSKTQRAWFQGL